MRNLSCTGIFCLFLFTHAATFGQSLSGEDGYQLWLRYAPIESAVLQQYYEGLLPKVWIEGTGELVDQARKELQTGLSSLLEQPINWAKTEIKDAGFYGGMIGQSSFLDEILTTEEKAQIGAEGYMLLHRKEKGRQVLLLAAKDERGLLYGVFHFLRLLQTGQSLEDLHLLENPAIQLRVLNHWDNLDRTVERGYAGFSIWNWHELPEFIDPRYADYARANASIGINGTVVTNVNANALVFRRDYIEKAAALAKVFRKYGIKIYLTARFSSPVELGRLPTADPLDPQVQAWWKDKVKEIYEIIPDFGGFLVKANSEGQPGPQQYGRNHADGANLLADALAPYGGVVMWRAFVYSAEEPEDRAKQAYNEFVPLDGKFRKNVLIQVKNGPIDFQPREPVHPLFGAMPKTPLMMEFQITKEYLGQGTHLVGLSSMYEEVLQTDTYAKGQGSTVAKVITGELDGHSLSGIAGVANIGTARNWTGNLFGQADWYAYGRLAWNPDLSSLQIFREWAAMTFNHEQQVQETVVDLLLHSHETCVRYMTPMGLHHLMATGHHYGPGPWVDNLSRADWNPVYYHKADATGLGFDRTASGSDALGQYAPSFQKKYADLNSCPPAFLLWFHHVPWNHKMPSGKSMWQELCRTYHQGASEVSAMKEKWKALGHLVDASRFAHVKMHLDIQEKEAKWWRDASLRYFQTFSQMKIPADLEQPQYDLKYYKSLSHPYAPGIRPRW